MYSTCIHCHARLGANESIEHFPVGRRIAFDAAKGRLWVVCANCRQWNLSPLDERWEAIEEAEKLYRDTRLRASTDNVGLARVREGTELIRIGDPLRPEFAAWRYGGRFGARWRQSALVSALAVSAVLAVGPLTGIAVGATPYWLYYWGSRARDRVRGVIRLDVDGDAMKVTADVAFRARIERSSQERSGWRLILPHHRPLISVGDSGADLPATTLRGNDAVEAARQLLPHLNSDGGRSRVVADAVSLLEDSGHMHGTFVRVADLHANTGDRLQSAALKDIPRPARLALEMAVHEETERRALEGELQSLEAAWKEAEEIAAIADSLTLPEAVVDQWHRITGRKGGDKPG